MPRNMGMTTAIAIVSLSYDRCSCKLVLITIMSSYINDTKQLRNVAIDKKRELI